LVRAPAVDRLAALADHALSGIRALMLSSDLHGGSIPHHREREW
jgi:hypothetical protein